MNTSNRIVYAIVLITVVLLFIFSDSPFVDKFNKISTLLLTVLTVGYVLLTYWILRSTRQSVQEQTRPYVVGSLPLDGFEVILSIKNVGNRPARDVRVEFQPSLDIAFHSTRHNALFAETLSATQPDHRLAAVTLYQVGGQQ